MKVVLKSKEVINLKKKIRMEGENMVQITTLNKVNCKFCGKELQQKEVVFELNNRQFSIKGQAERCDCEESKIYWEKIDYEKKQKEMKAEIQRKNEVINKLYNNSKMNIRLKSYSFNNYKVTSENKKALNKAREYAENYIKKLEKGSLFITGGVGTGKTHLAASIANELIRNEIPVVFGTLINLLNDIKDSYNSDGEKEGYIIERYSKVNMLIIDDLGKERPSEWTLEKLFTIINNRYENNLPVIITTNYNRDKLRERLANNNNYEIADSIISRLYEMCKGIAIYGNDKRKELV